MFSKTLVFKGKYAVLAGFSTLGDQSLYDHDIRLPTILITRPCKLSKKFREFHQPTFEMNWYLQKLARILNRKTLKQILRIVALFQHT
jgi:hypothetical protein